MTLDDSGYDLVFVVPGVWASGGFRTLYQWMNRLVASGSRVRLVAAFDGVGRALVDSRVEIRVPSKPQLVARSPLRVPARRLLGDRNPLSPTPRAVLDLLPRDGDVVTCWAPWLPDVLGRRRSILYAQHWEPVWFREGSAQARRTERAMLEPVPTIVNSSWLRERFPFERRADLHLVFPGVDHATFHPVTGPAPTGPDGGFHVVALGRDDPLKGLAELRQAVETLAQKRAVRLSLFGTAGRHLHRAGNLTEHALGTLSSEQLAALYREADVVVTPSWYESFPLPPLEAMACGVPVVTTAPGTEDFAKDGENALVVPARDIVALTHALTTIADDHALAARLRGGGASSSLAYTWDAGYGMFLRAVDVCLDRAG